MAVVELACGRVRDRLTRSQFGFIKLKAKDLRLVRMGFDGRLAPSQCETVSPAAMLQGIGSLGLGGASSRATTVSANPQVLWLPSQNGLLEDCPQRQRPMVVRPASPNGWPFGSTISKSPSMRSDPDRKSVV